jgi:hypothetical protein
MPLSPPYEERAWPSKILWTWLELVRGRTVSVISATPLDGEMRRFRQLVSTLSWRRHYGQDLKALRDGRWERPSRNLPASLEPACDTMNRKATIVIEH